MKKELGIFILLVVTCLIATVCTIDYDPALTGVSDFFHRLPHAKFISPANITNQINLIGISGIFSLGLGFVIITGGIDLSVGSMFALIGIVLAMALREWELPWSPGHYWPWPLAAMLVILIPMALGWGHGLLITRLKIQPFIVTLCGLLLYRSVARYIAHDSTKGFGNAEGFENLQSLASGSIHLFSLPGKTLPGQPSVLQPGQPVNLPMPFVLMLLIAVIMWFVLHRSIYGRYLFAVGRNEEAARFSGINTRRVISSSYVILGFLTGISGILFAFYTNSISGSTHGQSYELYGIAAAVLGGCSLRGGEGSVLGIIIGTALLQVLRNLVTLMGIPSELDFAVTGVVVLIGVLIDQIVRLRAQKKLTAAR